ncbi:MAG: hypothetical protein ACK5OC_24830 [Pirellula sp.]
MSQKSESTLLVEGSIPSGVVSQTQGGHDEYQSRAPKPAIQSFFDGSLTFAVSVTADVLLQIKNKE